MITAPIVEHLPPTSAEEVISVLADAFTGYPVMRWVYGPDGEQHHERLVRMFVMARVHRGEPLLGVRQGRELVATGIVSFPGPAPAPPAFLALREQTWRVIGADAERRYAAYGDATASFAFPSGATHLNMIGARRGCQRQGLGRAILEAVQDIARARVGSPGVELTTEVPANVAYYSRLGFEQVGHRIVGPGLESWGFFRPNDVPYSPIDCSLHDRLEAAATLGRTVALTYEAAEGRTQSRLDRIVSVGTRQGAEYARTSSGLEIRLDRILEVDGVSFRGGRA